MIGIQRQAEKMSVSELIHKTVNDIIWRIDKMTKIDIVSGFLGAGKTTLIKKLLKEAFSGNL